MQMTRWFGPADPVPLWTLRQVHNLTHIVSALHDVPPGVPWRREGVAILRAGVTETGLSLIESLPVHEDIERGHTHRDERSDPFLASLEASAAEGVPVVCHTFMPVFDRTRTALARPLPNGTTLTFQQEDADGTPGDEPPVLPGWAGAYTPQALWDLGVNLVVHPDDLPWPVMGPPRVVSTGDDFAFPVHAVPDEHNGLTSCTSSPGVRGDHGLPTRARRFAPRLHFVQARNVRRVSKQDFDEVAHRSSHGNARPSRPAAQLARLRLGVPIRPDHGWVIWGQAGRPGYGLYDRALEATHLQGLIDATGLEIHA